VSFLTADEVVERLSSHPSLRPVASSCVLSAVSTRDGWRFREADLNAWITEQLGRLGSEALC